MLTLPKPTRALEFNLEGEAATYSIPYPEGLGLQYSMRLKALGKIQEEAELRGAFIDILVDVLNDYAPGAADHMSAEGLGILLAEWTKGGNLGE